MPPERKGVLIVLKMGIILIELLLPWNNGGFEGLGVLIGWVEFVKLSTKEFNIVKDFQLCVVAI